MHRRTFRKAAPQWLAAAILLAAWMPVVIAPPPAPAQIRIPAEALLSDAEIADILARGRQFEGDGRWGQAISYYEEALRNYPHQPDLEHRLLVARMHYDVARRYADSSFAANVARMAPQQAVELYGEVLAKIQTHYVSAPQWRELLDRGVLQLEVALCDGVFLRQHLPATPQERIEAFRRDLHHTLDWRPIGSRQEAVDAVAVAAQLAHQQLGLAPAAVALEMTCGATGGLDDYSTFLTGAQLDDIYSQIEGNFVGLGVELKADEDDLLIVSTIPGSPAQQAGLRPGDRIVAVDGRTTREVSTDKAADMLRGEAGSTVEVTLRGPDGAQRTLRIRRQRIDVPSVEQAKIIDADYGVGYLRLSSFQKTTSRDVDAALWQLHRQGMRTLVIDLRGNPGGLLTSAVEVADKFIAEGGIVSTRGRSPREDFDYRAHYVGTWQMPLVVLIDRDTASASEIFAAAIRDHQRGEIVGERSFGKGSVQGIFPLTSGRGGVRLTTARFYSPAGHAINKLGVSPDVPVQITARVGDDGTWSAPGEDLVLAAGLHRARTRLTQAYTSAN